jgi:hypothetical protein
MSHVIHAHLTAHSLIGYFKRYFHFHHGIVFSDIDITLSIYSK